MPGITIHFTSKEAQELRRALDCFCESGGQGAQECAEGIRLGTIQHISKSLNEKLDSELRSAQYYDADIDALIEEFIASFLRRQRRRAIGLR